MPRRLHGYLVLDNDYSPFEFPGTKPVQDLQVTLAHEYNHILQFGYDAFQDPWFAESTATWMEDQVYNGINDYLRYVGRWVNRFDTPLTASSIKEYGSAVWNQWLARRYGTAIVREAWARAIQTRPGGFSVAAYDAAIRRRRRSDLSRDFARFAAAVAEWRTGKGFRESTRFPDMPRQGTLPLGARARDPPAQPHDLRDCCGSPPAAGAPSSSTPTAPDGTATGLALVGRIGSERGGTHDHPPRLQRAAAASCACASPTPAASAASPRSSSTPTPAPRLQRPPPRLALPDRPDAVRDPRQPDPVRYDV